MPDSPQLRYHLAQLAELCRNYPFDRKIVFVPSRQIGHNLGTALLRAGVSWVNLHLTTPADWAAKLAESKLKAAGWRPLVQGADHFFMLEAIQRMEWPSGHSFDGSYSAMGLAATCLKTARALRMAEIPPETLASADVALPGRSMFIDLYTTYCEWLEDEQLYDEATLFAEAQKASSPDSIVGILDETPLSESAYRFITSIGNPLVRIGRSDYGKPGPQHSALVRFQQTSPVGSGESAGPGGGVQTDGIFASDGDLVQIREAVGIENEVRGVLREYVRHGVSLDGIEIVYTSEDPYLPLLVDSLEQLDLPATFAAGIPVTLTRPGQALIGFFRWIAKDFDQDELVRLLRSRLLFLPPANGTARSYAVGDGASSSRKMIESTEVARIILEARVGPGRTSWATALGSIRARTEGEISAGISEGRRRHHERRLALIRGANSVLNKLYSLPPDSEHTSLREMARAGAAFLDGFGWKQTHRDKRARDSLMDRLTDLAESGSARGRLHDLSALMAELLTGHKVEAAIARPGHIYVVPLERAGYTGRGETAIIGLSETTFPGVATEDPILLDDERARVSGRLVLQRARASEPAWHFIRTMGMASGRVTLTASRRDTTDGRETYPSAIFEQIREQLGIKHPPVYRTVPDVEAALSGAEVVMALRGTMAVTREVLHERPWLLNGLQAVRNRSAVPFGPHDGWLGRETPELRPSVTKAVSASRLEALAACPHRYFLRYVLGVRPPDQEEERPGQWLAPLEFGSLLHEVLRKFMEGVSSRGEAVDVDRHTGEMMDHLYETVSLYRDRLPARYETGYRIDIRRLERAVQIFLAEESRRRTEPVGFEVSFGMGNRGDLAVPEPVALKLDDDVQLLLRGSIDRVDRSDDGYEVWDYKSGSTYDYDEADMLSGGRRLQWALYAYVLDELLARAGMNGGTQSSGYFFPSDREHGLRLSAKPPSRAEVGNRLAPLFELVGKGAFLHVQKNKACTYCDYRSICALERKGKKDLGVVFDDPVTRPFYDALATWMDVERTG